MTVSVIHKLNKNSISQKDKYDGNENKHLDRAMKVSVWNIVSWPMVPIDLQSELFTGGGTAIVEDFNIIYISSLHIAYNFDAPKMVQLRDIID